MSKKTEMVVFKSKRKKVNYIVKLNLINKRIYPTAGAKYLGVKIDQHLTWQHHINDLSVKQNRTNALLFNTDEAGFLTPSKIKLLLSDEYLKNC